MFGLNINPAGLLRFVPFLLALATGNKRELMREFLALDDEAQERLLDMLAVLHDLYCNALATLEPFAPPIRLAVAMPFEDVFEDEPRIRKNGKGKPYKRRGRNRRRSSRERDGFDNFPLGAEEVR